MLEHIILLLKHNLLWILECILLNILIILKSIIGLLIVLRLYLKITLLIILYPL